MGHASKLVWLWSFLCAFFVMGCGGPTIEPASTQGQTDTSCVREVCWWPPEVGTKYATFSPLNGEAIGIPEYPNVCTGVPAHDLILTYSETAPVASLQLIPLSRPEAWCTRIPKPTDERVRRLLEVCPAPETMSFQEAGLVDKNLLGQTEVPVRSPFFCDQYPRITPTTAESILMRSKNEAFQKAYDYNRAVAAALTQADADMERLTNESKWSLKRLFLKDPGTLEQIEQRVADTLNSIEPLPEYDDPNLDPIILAGLQAGFDQGQFDVQAKLFAIDAGIFVVEIVAMEIALGPLGGAKFLASAVSKSTRALKAAFVRLGDIPIFIPGAANGVGAFVRARHVLKALSNYHARKLEAAMFAEARAAGKTLDKLKGEETHHIVAWGSKKADKARKILEEFGIDIDHPANGVFLPGDKKAPNPNGSIVHSILGNKTAYYKNVEKYLGDATSQADAIRRLRRIGEALKDGTFFNANL